MNWVTLGQLFAFVIMVAGLVGIVLPFLPGIPLVWFGVFLSAVFTNFTVVDIPFLALMGVLVLITFLLEYWSSHWGTKEFRITPYGIFGAVLGSFVGLFFGLLPALTIGPLLGTALGEMLTGKESIYTIETDSFKIIGYVGSTIVKTTIGVIIIGLWLAKVF